MALRIFGPARDVAIAALSDPSTGFNANLAVLVAEFGLPEMAIDFAAGSRNFVQKYIERDSPTVDLASHFDARPLALAMYSTEAANAGRQTFTLFSGPLLLNLDFYYRLRSREMGDGVRVMEDSDTETAMHAITEAALVAMHNYQSNGSVTYDRLAVIGRSPILEYPDGYMQRTSLDLSFEVTAI